jgi:hypothetical protein
MVGLSPQTVHRFDAVVVLWVAAWIVLAIFVGRQVMALRDLSTTMVKAGVAVRTTGAALEGFGSLPLVGGDVRRVAAQARSAGASAVESGRKTRGSVRRLAVLLGIAVGLVPTLPLLVVYVLLRERWRRARAVRAADARASP